MRVPRAPTMSIALAVTLIALAGCGSARATSKPPPVTSTTEAAAPTSITSTPSTPARPSTTAPVPTTSAPVATPAFRATIDAVSASTLRSTYRAGCPVAPAQLRILQLSYWGFDAQAHTGTMVVAGDTAVEVVAVFRSLYAQRFPIRRMQLEDDYGGSDPASMAADNTSGFNCRNAVATGPPRWSAHAFGTAIDVNPVENPYVEGGVVQPPNGGGFVDRADVRAGMSEPGGVLNRAFAAVGWQWGGRWTATPDYQHFSADGR